MTSPAPEAAVHAPRRRAIHAQVGAGAGLLALALGLGIALGALWGWIRPAYVAEVTGDGIAIDQVASPANVEFAAFGWFALITGVAGALIGLTAWRQTRRGAVIGGAGWMWWVIACAIACAFAVFMFGDWVAFRGLPNQSELEPGTTLHVVPPVNPRIGWVSAPFTAGFVFWVANLSDYLRLNRQVEAEQITGMMR